MTGLPGSGKSCWAHDYLLTEADWYMIDDPRSLYQLPSKKGLMKLDLNLMIVDPHLCDPKAQESCEKFIHSEYDATPEWVCFENDPVQCKLNVLKRNDRRKVLGMIHMMSQVYVIPPRALVLPVYKETDHE